MQHQTYYNAYALVTFSPELYPIQGDKTCKEYATAVRYSQVLWKQSLQNTSEQDNGILTKKAFLTQMG